MSGADAVFTRRRRPARARRSTPAARGIRGRDARRRADRAAGARDRGARDAGADALRAAGGRVPRRRAAGAASTRARGDPRPGKRLALAEATLRRRRHATSLRARATLLRRGDVALPRPRGARRRRAPGPDGGPPARTGPAAARPPGFHLTGDRAALRPRRLGPRPALGWFRLRDAARRRRGAHAAAARRRLRRLRQRPLPRAGLPHAPVRQHRPDGPPAPRAGGGVGRRSTPATDLDRRRHRPGHVGPARSARPPRRRAPSRSTSTRADRAARDAPAPRAP